MKKKELVKSENKLALKSNHRKLRKFMATTGAYFGSDKLFDGLTKQLTEYAGKIGKKLPDQFYKDYNDVSFALGIDTHVPVANGVKAEYRPFLFEMTKRIEQEYDCKTAIEKSLAEMVALSHIRVIHLSTVFNCYIVGSVDLTKEKTDYYNMIGKELDRASKQLLNATLTLRQIKTPILPFNVNAKTAFIAQNQQINNYAKKDEINERQ